MTELTRYRQKVLRVMSIAALAAVLVLTAVAPQPVKCAAAGKLTMDILYDGKLLCQLTKLLT